MPPVRVLTARFGSVSGAGITNTYDGFGRQLTSVSSLTGSKTLTYDYDLNDNRTRITHNDGVVYWYKYDQLNRLTHVRETMDAPSHDLAAIAWRPKGYPGYVHQRNRFIRSVDNWNIDAFGRPMKRTVDVFHGGSTYDLVELASRRDA